MKKVLITNGGYSEVPLIKAAKEEGYYVIVTGNNRQAPGNLLADEYIPCDYSDKEAIYELAKTQKVDAICSACNDFAYLSTIYACEKLGLGGHDSYETGLTLHHKDKYRKFAAKYHIPMPQMVKCHNEKELEAVNKLSFPVIIKPVDLFSGIGMRKCMNMGEVKEGFREALSKTRQDYVVIEEFLEGSNHGFTTIIQDGKVTFYMADNEQHDYTPYAVSGACTPSDVGENAVKSLIRQAETIAEKLQLCDGLLHIQFILHKEKGPVILEVCRRSPGDLYIEFVKYATGVDYPKVIVQLETGKKIEHLTYKQVKDVWIRQVVACTQEGRLMNVMIDDSMKDYVQEQMISFERGREIAPGEIYKAGIVFLKGSSKEEMEKLLSNITKRFGFEME